MGYRLHVVSTDINIKGLEQTGLGREWNKMDMIVFSSERTLAENTKEQITSHLLQFILLVCKPPRK